MGDTVPERAVKEAIVRCDFDAEVAVNTLLNNPVGHRGAGQCPDQYRWGELTIKLVMQVEEKMAMGCSSPEWLCTSGGISSHGVC